MDRASLLKFWNDAWTTGLWATAWSKSLEGLTPQQAAWKAGPHRHSIWQIASHMIFWREDALDRLQGKPRPSDDEIQRRNFPEPEITAPAWQATRDRFRASQERIAAAIADSSQSLERLAYMLPHDCYHMGQINLLRALQNLPPIE